MQVTVCNSAGNATLSLMQGIFQRAGVVVLLIASLLAPYGRCQSPGRTTSHACCVQDSAPKASVTGNCCIVRSQLPAVVEERPALGPTALPATPDFVPLMRAGNSRGRSLANPVAQILPAAWRLSPQNLAHTLSALAFRVRLVCARDCMIFFVRTPLNPTGLDALILCCVDLAEAAGFGPGFRKLRGVAK